MINSLKFEYWYAQFMLNGVNVNTLQRLVDADKLTQEEVNKMIEERQEKYGY